MNVNPYYFSFPPHISTSWEHVAAIHMQENDLIVHLIDGEIIMIFDLTDEEVSSIFLAHEAYLESQRSLELQLPPLENSSKQKVGMNTNDLPSEASIRFGFGAFDGFGTALQHNPAQANAPDLPKEILEKIGNISKIIAPEDPNALPKAEPHCNCFYCQVSRAVQKGLFSEEHTKSSEEEQISDEELSFQQWDILQTSDNLYTVTNRLDTDEKYNVFLGHPVGCTCGKDGCEHIVAVLKS